MSKHKVVISGVDTATLPTYTNEVMRELFVQLQAGQSAMRDKLIEGNLRLVLSIIQRFAYRVDDLNDLFQVGCIGLMKAIDNFDLAHNVRFSTYAVPMIIGEVRRYLRDNHSLRVSRSLRDTAYKALQAKEKWMAERAIEPTLAELAEQLEVKREDVALALDAVQDPVSLFEPIFSDGGDPIFVVDQLRDEGECTEQWTTKMALQICLQQLSTREKLIVEQRYFNGKTQMEVAEEIGISQAQVSRLEKAAMKQMERFVSE